MCTLHGISRATMYRDVKETDLPTDRTPHGMSEIPPMKRANLHPGTYQPDNKSCFSGAQQFFEQSQGYPCQCSLAILLWQTIGSSPGASEMWSFVLVGAYIGPPSPLAYLSSQEDQS